jgi:hypothetical protein
MSAATNPTPAETVDQMKTAAHLLNRCDLRGGSEAESRTFNAAEQAVRDGIALIEAPHKLFEAAPLDWGRDRLCGFDILVGRGLGLKYYVAKNVDESGWTWTLGSGPGPVEPTQEAAMAACQADFTERLRASIRPLAASI